MAPAPLPTSTTAPLTGRPIPERPAAFTPYGTPPDPRFYADLDALKSRDGSGRPWWQTRPIIKARIGVVHTNGASREGSIQSAINHGNRAQNNTKPTWQVADGRAVRLVPSNRRCIANSTPNHKEGQWGDSSFFTTAIETRDSGYLDDPGISDFLEDDAELVAMILAYDSLIEGAEYEIKVPEVWYGSGVVTHTHPFDAVYTIVTGKICPGLKKKATFWDVIVARAKQIQDAWTYNGPGPAPTEPVTRITVEEDMQLNFEIGANRIYDTRNAPDGMIAEGETRKVSLGVMSNVFGGTITVFRTEGEGYVTVAGEHEPSRRAKTSITNFDDDGEASGYKICGCPDGHIYITATRGPCHVAVDMDLWGSGTPS